ncbi:unnamed protein product, partial [Iphiclides podalirius]
MHDRYGGLNSNLDMAKSRFEFNPPRPSALRTTHFPSAIFSLPLLHSSAGHVFAIVLVCLAAFAAVESYGLGGGGGYGSRGLGGGRYNDVSGGGGGQGYNSGASGGGLSEGHRRNKFTSYTNSESDSGHLSSGQGGYGTNAGGSGRLGRIRGGGSGFGRGRFGGSRIGSGLWG